MNSEFWITGKIKRHEPQKRNFFQHLPSTDSHPFGYFPIRNDTQTADRSLVFRRAGISHIETAVHG